MSHIVTNQTVTHLVDPLECKEMITVTTITVPNLIHTDKIHRLTEDSFNLCLQWVYQNQYQPDETIVQCLQCNITHSMKIFLNYWPELRPTLQIFLLVRSKVSCNMSMCRIIGLLLLTVQSCVTFLSSSKYLHY